jgi:hypothetical protein
MFRLQRERRGLLDQVLLLVLLLALLPVLRPVRAKSARRQPIAERENSNTTPLCGPPVRPQRSVRS